MHYYLVNAFLGKTPAGATGSLFAKVFLSFSSGSSLLAFPTTEVYATPLCATVLWCIYVMEEMVDKEMDKKVDKEVDEEVDEEGKEKVYATPPQPPLCHRQWWDAFKTV